MLGLYFNSLFAIVNTPPITQRQQLETNQILTHVKMVSIRNRLGYGRAMHEGSKTGRYTLQMFDMFAKQTQKEQHVA